MTPMNPQKPQGAPTAPPPDTRRPAMIGLLLVLLLIAGGLFLSHVLRGMAQVQDCALEGRTNCAPIDSAGPGGG
jgi:hypothetical protein